MEMVSRPNLYIEIFTCFFCRGDVQKTWSLAVNEKSDREWLDEKWKKEFQKKISMETKSQGQAITEIEKNFLNA